MKICIINNIFTPYDRGGGSERITEIIFDELKKQNHEIFVITTAPKKLQKKEEHLKNIYYIKSCFLNLEQKYLISRLVCHIKNLFDIKKYYEIKKILKKEDPEIVITNNLIGLGFLLPLAIKKLRIKHIHILHDIQLLHPSGIMYYKQEKILDTIHAKTYQKIVKFLFGSPYKIISPSNWLLQLYNSKKFFSFSKKEVLLNPMKLSDPPAKEKQKDNKIKFLYVGQIEKHKGAPFLTKVFKELEEKFRKINPNYELKLAGSGKDVDKCKKIAQNSKKIKFLGRLKNIAVIDLMKNSDCLIVPSLCYDNSPTVIYEATTKNLPIIASDIGGISELKKIADITLFEPDNKESLKKEIKKILQNKKILIQEKKDKNFMSSKNYTQFLN